MDSETVGQGRNVQEMFALRKKPDANDEIFFRHESQKKALKQ